MMAFKRNVNTQSVIQEGLLIGTKTGKASYQAVSKRRDKKNASTQIFIREPSKRIMMRGTKNGANKTYKKDRKTGAN